MKAALALLLTVSLSPAFAMDAITLTAVAEALDDRGDIIEVKQTLAGRCMRCFRIEAIVREDGEQQVLRLETRGVGMASVAVEILR
jgi:hypothetical protein